MITLLFSVLLFASDTPAAAPTQAAPAISSKAEKKICRVDPAHTGTRMAKRMCLTQTEWDVRAAGKSVGDLKTIGAR